jgi:predicted GTPase
MTVSMKSAEFQLHEAIVQLQEMFSLLDFDRRLYDTLEETKNLIKTRKYNVAIMGEFKRGKSTLLNSLLGVPVLPADATPTTAAISRITYGSKERAVLFFCDGTSEEIPFDGLKDHTTKLTENGQAVSASLKEAVLYYPSVICQNYIDLIDTPGLNDEAKMTQITIDLLPEVDAVILPIHARFPFSSTEKLFVCQLLESDNVRDIIFVVTFLDQLDEDDYIYENYMKALSDRIRNEVFTALDESEAEEATVKKAHVILDHLQICGLSAFMALKAFTTNNKALLNESRFPEFRKMLLSSLTAGQSENSIRSAVSRIESVIGQIDVQNTKKLEEFDALEANLKSRRENAEAFFQGILPATENLFNEIQPKLDEAANRLHLLKNILIKSYISALSQITENTHMAIFNAVKPETDNIPGMVGIFLNEKILNDVKQNFLSCIDKLAETASAAGVGLDGNEFRLPLLAALGDNLKNVCFRFTISPYPDTNDLATADMTGHMTKCIDQSITELYWLLKYSFSEIQRSWYPLIFRHSSSVQADMQKKFDKEAASIDIHKKAYAKNYPALCSLVEGIKTDSWELLEKIKEGE